MSELEKPSFTLRGKERPNRERIAALERQLAEAQAEIKRLEKLPLQFAVHGEDRCSAQPNTPCPTCATVARLQERVEEAEADTRRWKKAKGESDNVIRRIVTLVPRDVEREDIIAAVKRTVRERDEAEALAERRKKALEAVIPFAEAYDPNFEYLPEARAAIEEKP